jgi:hypothetical protein
VTIFRWWLWFISLKYGSNWYRSFSRPPLPLHCLAKSVNSAHAHWMVGW